MTDTIEAVALALRQCADENYDIRFDYGMAHEYAQAAITAHTKALVDGAGDTRLRALAAAEDGIAFDRPVLAKRLHQAAATIAALKAEIERLTEREAQAKLDGVRAGIEAALAEVRHRECRAPKLSESPTQWQRRQVREAIRALDVAAIARRDSALSDLIAGDADLIVQDTLADSDGDDGA